LVNINAALRVRQEIVRDAQQGKEALVVVMIPSLETRAVETPAVCLKGG
jgi:hypothetical protein